MSRVLSVSSEQSAFTEQYDPIASTSAVPYGAEPDTGVRVPQQRRLSLSRSPSPATVPLLSPIPWLVRRDDDDSLEQISNFDLTSGTRRSPANHSSSPEQVAKDAPTLVTSPTTLSPTPTTTTPTGGLVDEVDSGTGTSEVAPPVPLTHAAETSQSNGVHSEELQQRFIRASSPRVDESDRQVQLSIDSVTSEMSNS